MSAFKLSSLSQIQTAPAAVNLISILLHNQQIYHHTPYLNLKFQTCAVYGSLVIPISNKSLHLIKNSVIQGKRNKERALLI